MKEFFSKKAVRIAIIVILALATIGACIYLGITMSEENREKKDYESLSDDMTSASNKVEGEQEKTERMIKLEELHNQYPDVVAWLEVPNTNMSYPIVQTDNNDYYLDHTYKKEYSARGSIFLDKDVSFDRPSDNFLIYGHRNKNGAMFEDLLQFEKEDFYKEHKTINSFKSIL